MPTVGSAIHRFGEKHPPEYKNGRVKLSNWRRNLGRQWRFTGPIGQAAILTGFIAHAKTGGMANTNHSVT